MLFILQRDGGIMNRWLRVWEISLICTSFEWVKNIRFYFAIVLFNLNNFFLTNHSLHERVNLWFSMTLSKGFSWKVGFFCVRKTDLSIFTSTVGLLEGVGKCHYLLFRITILWQPPICVKFLDDHCISLKQL